MPLKTFDAIQFRIDSISYRSDNNISRDALSTRLKVNEKAIFYYETGRVTPKIELVYNLCAIMEKDIHSYFK